MGGNRLWSNPANWNGGLPGSNDKSAVRRGNFVSSPIIDSGTTALANVVVIGDWSSDVDNVQMTGGSLATNGWLLLGYGSSNKGTIQPRIGFLPHTPI